MENNSKQIITTRSPGKINLFLHVLRKREDNYHELETIFQFLDFCDFLTFELIDTPDIFRQDDHGFQLPEQDLIIQAAQLLCSTLKIKNPTGVKITLNKQIPPGSGMGGGSSNAATTLVALNKLWNLNLPREDLLPMARQLGADVPVFIHGQSCWASGIGDILENFDVPETWYCICIPQVLVSTQRVFQHPDLPRSHQPISHCDFQNGETCNDLESVTRSLYPEVDQAISIMSQFGKAQMNGSGSSVFVKCDSKHQAQQLSKKLPNRLNCFVSKTLNDIRGY